MKMRLSLNSITKVVAVIGFLLSIQYGNTQVEYKYSLDEPEDESKSYAKSFISYGYMFSSSFSGEYLRRIDLSSGFDIRLQLRLFKGAFICYKYENLSFDTEKQSSSPVPRLSGVISNYIIIGYEEMVYPRLLVGVDIGILGDSRYRNITGEGSLIDGVDRASSNFVEAYIEYKIVSSLFIYLNYSYRWDQLEINVPQEVQSDFDRVSYSNFSIGLRLRLLKKDFYQILTY